jgi:hypothetical protein
MSIPSICLPQCLTSTTKSQVQQVFTIIFKKDYVERIDEVQRSKTKNGKTFKFKMFFIHFNDEEVEEELIQPFVEAFDKDTGKQIYYKGENGPFWWATKAREKKEPEEPTVVVK